MIRKQNDFSELVIVSWLNANFLGDLAIQEIEGVIIIGFFPEEEERLDKGSLGLEGEENHDLEHARPVYF